MKFLHSMIRVKDIEASLKFYTKVLDMELEHKKRLDDCWLYFLNDKEKTCQIELTYNDDTPGEGYNIGNNFGHFAFECENLDDIEEKMQILGYCWEIEPFYMPEIKTRIAFLLDPDNNEIELIEKV